MFGVAQSHVDIVVGKSVEDTELTYRSMNHGLMNTTSDRLSFTDHVSHVFIPPDVVVQVSVILYMQVLIGRILLFCCIMHRS